MKRVLEVDMNIPLAVAFIVFGGLLLFLQIWGFFRKTWFQKRVPWFLIGNGIGFFVPAYLWLDGLIFAVLAVFVVEVTSYKKGR